MEGACTAQLLLGKDEVESIEGFKDALLHYNKVSDEGFFLWFDGAKRREKRWRWSWRAI